MNPRELLEKRQPNWYELDRLCNVVSSRGGRQKMSGAEILRFATLYRAACADLSLAEANNFPSSVVERLQQLVARSHGLLYQGKRGHLETAFWAIPQAVATDPYVHASFAVFWILFIVFCLLVKSDAVEGLGDVVVGNEQLQHAESMFAGGVERTMGENFAMAGHYVWNNTGIGLMCFALGTFVLPGLGVLASNAIMLGSTFGHMMRDQTGAASDNFQEFVMSHGPFELTAVILAAGAGFRIGMSWIDTGGLTRGGSLIRGARRSMPILMLAVMLFLGAAAIEGLLSALNFGSEFNLWFKGFVSWLTSSALMFYIVILGLLQPLIQQKLNLENDSLEVENTWT
ncbi:MAG: stage II sporulation protein M [Planctomycetaceae bacterium]|nr:stage II sporulation protein M [Planctomycetaceae bacterium]